VEGVGDKKMRGTQMAPRTPIYSTSSKLFLFFGLQQKTGRRESDEFHFGRAGCFLIVFDEPGISFFFFQP